MSDIIFSVITPTYRRLENLKSLHKHLSSMNSSHLFEWVIVYEEDDLDTKDYISNIKDLKILTIKNNKKFVTAFQKGAKLANGTFVSFLGDDDRLKKDIFKFLNNKIEIFQPNWIIGQGSYINDDNQEIRKYITKVKNLLLKNYSKNILLLIDYIMTPSSFCKKKYLEKVNYFDDKHWYGADYICWIRLSSFLKPLIINETLSYCKYNKKSYTGSFDIFRFLSLYNNLKKEKKNLFLNFLQFLIIMYIALYNFITKKILK